MEWGLIVEIKRPDGGSEFYRYDHAGNITGAVDGEGNTTRYEYGANGQLLRMTDPLGNAEEYHYDSGNRLSRMTDRNGTETTYTYNLYGSLTGRRAQNPEVPGTKLSEAYEYTPEGLLKSAISSGSAPGAPNVYTMGMRYSYEYDAMGRLTKKSASGRTLLFFAYDLNGNLIRQEDVTGKVTEYSYNELDILESINDNSNELARYAYYPDGTIKSLQSGSLYTEYGYDADKNLASLKTLLGDEVLVDNHYTYDHNGNRTEKQQSGGNTRYTYDGLNQLTRVEYPGYTEELYYDRAGNRRRRVSAGVEKSYKYDPANHLTEYTKGGVKTTFTYDNAGNLTADDRARYTYDLFNRTEKVETFDGHVQVNRYDAENLRHEMEEDGKLVQFIFRGQEVVMEETGDNKIRHIRGYELIASDAESARMYYHYASDEMGSITHVAEGKDVLNRYDYDAWGNLTLCEEAVENRFKFNGQQYDSISQQYYLRARYYNPVIARFTQEDTYRGAGLNLYVYCWNNPVYYVDPSGHQPKCVKDAAQRYMEDGMSKEDAYRLAYAEYNDRKLADTSNLTPQEIQRLQDRQSRMQAQLEPGQSGNSSVWGIMYQAECATHLDYDGVRTEAGIGDISQLRVLTIYEQNGSRYMDVNPTARDESRKTSDRIPAPEGQRGLTAVNNTVERTHAEIGSMYQAYDKQNFGGNATLTVFGEPICRYCRIDIKKMSLNLGLSSLYVDERATNNHYSFNTSTNPYAFYNLRNHGQRWIPLPQENE